ncbi:hypothetical protein GWK47_032029 [Chionoecetes opilio]|uniref:Uncharacterized protein n=1 Tax=Chionoecetes opilio TaxID=41210 RepID=A0A8J4YWE4_CHIOP|nr:hypothetical protein GWK47_032029 [Chionoecetes opilio]
MAQYLQGLMEEGMGGVETPPAGSGRAERAAWSNLPPYHNATRYTPSPDITPATQQQLWPTTRQHRPPPPPGPGGATVGMSPATFEAWATSVEDYSSICGWAAPTAAPYVRLLCNTEGNSACRAWERKCSAISTTGQRVVKRGDGHAVFRSVGGILLSGTGIDDSVCHISPVPPQKQMSAALGP